MFGYSEMTEFSKVFVTGATGFLGRNFVAYLLSLPQRPEVLCLVRNTEKAGFIRKLGAHVIQGDLLKPETYQDVAESVEGVFHIAAKVGLKNGDEFYTVNRKGTRCLLETLKPSKIKRLMYVSSIAAIDRDWSKGFDTPLDENSPPHPNTDYGKSKRQAEELIVASGLPYTILRPAYIYGPYPRVDSSMDRVVYHVRDRVPYTQFPFPGRASEIYVKDLAEALWVVANHPKALNEDFFIADPEPVNVADFFHRLAATLGVAYHSREVTPQVMARFRRLQFHRHPQDPVVRILYTDYFHCRSEKLYRYTGYRPRIGLDRGMVETIDWYRQEGKL